MPRDPRFDPLFQPLNIGPDQGRTNGSRFWVGSRMLSICST